MNVSSPSSAKLAAPPHGGGEVVDVPLVDRAHGDDLLREHVERVAHDAGRLDRARPHPLDHDRDLEQVAPVLREDLAGARLAHLVAGPADALQPAAHRARRLDLDHEVDRAHVDAELEAAGGDERAQAAGLELVLDEEPLLACERAVVGLDQLLARELVEPRREPLGEPAVVAEDQRGAVVADQLEDPRVHVRPDAGPRLAVERRAGRLLDPGAERAHVLDRDDDLEVELLADAGVDDGDRARPVGGATAEEARDLVERALRGRQPDALRWRAC